MKTLRLILLVFFFLHSKTGVAINLHYCSGHLASISWMFNLEGCGMELSEKQATGKKGITKTDCCSDSAFIAQDQSPQTSKLFHTDLLVINDLYFPSSPLVIKQIERPAILIFPHEFPPIRKRYKKHCQFIFYG